MEEVRARAFDSYTVSPFSRFVPQMYFEKRLVVSHEIGDPEVKCGAYGDLGALHGEMANYTQAISCLEHKMRLAQDSGDLNQKAEAIGSLGKVYAKMQEFDKAIECHRMDLQISEDETQDLHGQARAHGNLGNTFELMRRFDEAIRHQEEHLRLASQLKDKAAKALAFSSLGRIYHARGDLARATEYLQQVWGAFRYLRAGFGYNTYILIHWHVLN